MPVAPDTPEPLATALESMEAAVQGTKRSLSYCAPEMMDRFWGQLQMDLAESMGDLFTALSAEEIVTHYNKLRAFVASYAEWKVTADLNRLDGEVLELLDTTPKLDR
jgi:hypothetical protein